MGIYVNPGNNSFRSAVRSEIYVDKTKMLCILNKALNTENRYFAVSRARRFGKSMAAGMIDAYYSRGCESRELFSGYEISKTEDYEKYLNKFNVLHFDVASFYNGIRNSDEMISKMDKTLLSEMKAEFPYLEEYECSSVPDALKTVYIHDKIQFVVIIDEWECIIRDAKDNEKLIMDYLRYLRGFFKTEESKQFLALGYLTGILPVKKMEGESALNNFEEYTMIRPKALSDYFGFTEDEVRGLCEDYNIDIEMVKQWYDGYIMKRVMPKTHERVTRHIYNPQSIVMVMRNSVMESYWKNTGAFRGLNDFIALNEKGLKDDVIRMLAGERCKVDVSTFQNDLTSYTSKDDVLTALIHMGYLGYDSDTEEAFIPNTEVAEVFESAIKVGEWSDIRDALNKSDELLKATWEGDSGKVADAIAKSQQNYASIINFHDENDLACAVMMSYYTAKKYYYIKRELPAGRGFADIAFIPRREGEKPAMIVELKWDKSAETALDQIKDKDYYGALSDYNDKMLLVGINYSKKTGEYSCKIEER